MEKKHGSASTWCRAEWLDQLAAEILARSGATISRSEIARAAIATFRELHRLVPSCRRAARTW